MDLIGLNTPKIYRKRLYSLMDRRTHKFLTAILTLGVITLIAGTGFIRWGNDIACKFESGTPSRSFGSTKDGRLVNGKRLPTSGQNFRAYGRLPIALGRNSLNGRIRDVVLEAYAKLNKRLPQSTFVYGECSWPNGGRLRPHATHRNGLSIDFMVPVLNGSGSADFKADIANKFGYAVHFDTNGWCEAQQSSIDFNAIAEHLHCLADAAEAHGLSIWRVIFAPELQTHLFATERGKSLRDRLVFSRKKSWVRHDEHYHVDFNNPDERSLSQLYIFRKNYPVSKNILEIAGYERSFAMKAKPSCIDEMIEDIMKRPSDDKFDQYALIISYMRDPIATDHINRLCRSPCTEVRQLAEKFRNRVAGCRTINQELPPTDYMEHDPH